MSNPLYQAVIRELEQLLSPRVVSRLLKEGLQQQDRSPETVALEDVEEILKGPVYRQLQVVMQADQAKQEIADALGRLTEVVEGPKAPVEPEAGADAEAGVREGDDTSAPTASAAALERQADELIGLQAALKPFNLYFEWPEVQKLRAQVQLLEGRHLQDHEAPDLVAEAHRQLAAVRQKLEDQLVIQARDLTELDEAFERVQTVGGVKVRRLENLIGHVREAQDARQLAQAEVERARKLANDLRKLVESAVYQEDVAVGPGAPRGAEATGELSPEVSQRLAQLDRDAASHDLRRLAEDHGHLLDHLPELADRIEAARRALQNGERPGTTVDALTKTVQEAAERQRTALRAEFEQIARAARDLPPAVNVAELLQALAVAEGVLETTLPSLEDTTYVRRLHRLALQKRDELRRTEEEASAQRAAALADQAALAERARRALDRYGDVLADPAPAAGLAEAVEALEAAQREDRLAPDLAASVRSAEERLEAAVALDAEDERVRTRAELRSLRTRVEGLPNLDLLEARIAGVRRELDRLIDAASTGDVEAVQIDAVRSLVGALRRDAIDTCRTRLDQLAQRASEVQAEELLGQIQSANNVLEDDLYPDVRQLETALRQQRDAYREQQYGTIHELEREASDVLGTPVDAAQRLDAFLSRAREQLEAGGVASDLDAGWRLLDEARAAVERRVADFEPRLDAALQAFQKVAMLNSEDVATVRRILKHLDSQRDAFDRISIGLRVQLVTALDEAETLLDKLREEVDATRAIADQLMSGGVLDDVLGLFGEPAEPTASSTAGREPTSAPADEGAAEGASDDGTAAQWLDAVVGEAGVRAGAILDANGWVAGGLDRDPGDVRARILPLQHALADLGAALDAGPVRLATVEQDDDVLLVAWVDGDRHLVLHLETPTAVNPVGDRVRTELDDLQNRLRDPSNA